MENKLLARVEAQAWFHRYPRGAPLFLFILTIAVTVAYVVSIESTEARARSMALERRATEVAAALQRRAAENVAYLTAASTLVAHDANLSDAEFGAFVAQLNAGHAGRGTLGMGLARLRSQAELPALAKALSARGIAVRTPGDAPDPPAGLHAIITAIEPLDASNRPALGVDMYAEAVRREAIDRAVATRKVAISGLVRLVQDGKGSTPTGFMIFAPVVFPSDAGKPPAELVYSPVRAADFVASAIEPLGERRYDLAIYDGAVTSDRHLAGTANVASGAALERRVQIADRTWILLLSDRFAPGFSPLSILALLFGTSLALLLLLVARYIMRRAAEDRLVVERLTSDAAMRNTLTRELNHRVKNTLANVLSIMALTRRSEPDIDSFVESLSGRVRALSATHDILSQREWGNAPIGDVARSELAPYVGEGVGPVALSGPAIMLAPNDALSLGLALHELATNAAKYGALSRPGGSVRVDWKLLTPDLAEVRWRETGGPPVEPPGRRGFGLDLLEKIIPHELRNPIGIRFRPEGVECTLKLPVRKPRPFALHEGPVAGPV